MARPGLRARLAKYVFRNLTAADLEWLTAGQETASGQVVNQETALKIAAFHACVRVIAETIGSLPLKVYESVPEGSRVAAGHPLQTLLRRRPNSWQTSMEFREMLTAYCLMRGNAYAFILQGQNVLTGAKYIRELIPLNPDRMSVKQNPDFSLTYQYIRADGQAMEYRQDQIFHLRGMTLDGFTGVSLIAYARETLGKSLGMQEYSAKLFANNAQPGLVLSKDGRLSDDAQKRLKEQFKGKDVHKTMILEEGLKAERLSFSAEDTQFIETVKLNRSEIAGLCRVPPHKIGDLDRATFSNMEEQNLSFVTDCVRPWAVRWEQALGRDLFINEDRFYPEMNLEGLLRGNTLARAQSYAIGRNWGWYSANDVRRMENQNTIGSQGDIYLQPVNMTQAQLAATIGGNDGNQK